VNDTVAFISDERNGIWGPARDIPGLTALGATSSLANAVTCTAAGVCVASGWYTANAGGGDFTVTETSGSWGDAAGVPGGTAAIKEDPGTELTCAAPGNCVETGGGVDTKTGDDIVYVTTEFGGVWAKPRELAGVTTGAASGPILYSVSCPDLRDCTLTGTRVTSPATANYQTVSVFVADEKNGVWGATRDLPGIIALESGAPLELRSSYSTSVSCSAAGDCAVGGVYFDANPATGGTGGGYLAYIANETNGTWGKAHPLPGTAGPIPAEPADIRNTSRVNDVTCSAPGYCVAGGQIESPSASDAFVSTETAGAWGTARFEPAPANGIGTNGQVAAISCAARENCAAVGYAFPVQNSLNSKPFVVDEAPPVVRAATRTTLHLSAASVRYGREQSERLTFTVTSGQRGVPAGKVTVKTGRTVLCVITLTDGRGGCAPRASSLARGVYQLIARYSGNTRFAPSVSAAVRLTVTA
jgi:hypothetical protein